MPPLLELTLRGHASLLGLTDRGHVSFTGTYSAQAILVNPAGRRLHLLY